jgi:hypothetical protein
VPVRPTQVIIHAIAMMSPEIIHISTVSNSSCAIRLWSDERGDDSDDAPRRILA